MPMQARSGEQHTLVHVAVALLSRSLSQRHLEACLAPWPLFSPTDTLKISLYRGVSPMESANRGANRGATESSTKALQTPRGQFIAAAR